MNKKLCALISMFAAVILLANGCGGAGGVGRYTISSDFGDFEPGPLGPGGSGGFTPGPGPAQPSEQDPQTLLESGWQEFELEACQSAIEQFNRVLSLDNITEAQKIDAYNGLGWAQTKLLGTEAGMAAFKAAAAYNDEAAVGLAAALMQRAGKEDINQAVNLLEGIGLNDTTCQFLSKHKINVSSAEAHAMLAYCYFCRNKGADKANAKTQINAARVEDASSDSTVYQIYEALQAQGLL